MKTAFNLLPFLNIFSGDVYFANETIEQKELSSINKEENKKQEIEYEKIIKNNELTKDIESKPFYLNLPVDLLLFEKYYKYSSYFQYLDKYEFQDQLYIFDARKSNNLKSINYKNYAHWLPNLRSMKSYKYLASMDQNKYLPLDKTKHINWVDGFSGTENNLRQILNLQLPSEKQEAFTSHKKQIFLNHDHYQSRNVNMFNAYFKEGKINNGTNIIENIAYGKLKQNANKWESIYSTYNGLKKTASCKNATPTQNYFVSVNYYVKNGFDSICDRLRFKTKFFQNQEGAFTTGYYQYKYTVPNHWDEYHYFYFLGKFQKYSDVQVFVNDNENNEKSVWYIDYDNIFQPEIFDINKELKEFSVQVGLNYPKINNIHEFLKISSGMYFEMTFMINDQKETITFSLKDILSNKKFRFRSKQQDINLNFSNFKVQAKTDKRLLNLISDDSESFKYEVNTDLLKLSFNWYDELFFYFDQNKQLFYSELLDKKKLASFFFLKNKDQTKKNIDIDSLPFLNVEVSGSDFSKDASIRFFDIISKTTKTGVINNLLTLPKISDNKIYFQNSFQNIDFFLKQEYWDFVNDYFWNNVDIKLKEKNIFDGIYIYELESKHKDPNIKSAWNSHFRGKKTLSVVSSHKVIELKNDYKTFVDHGFQNLNIKNLFFITPWGKGCKYQIDDFSFSKIHEDDKNISILAKLVDEKNENVSKTKTFNLEKNIQQSINTDFPYPKSTAQENTSSEFSSLAINKAESKSKEWKKPLTASTKEPISTLSKLGIVSFSALALTSLQLLKSTKFKFFF